MDMIPQSNEPKEPKVHLAAAGKSQKNSSSFIDEELLFSDNKKARDGTRTRGLDLGKVALHQLSHSRIYLCFRKHRY